jgi:hypothetical protein
MQPATQLKSLKIVLAVLGVILIVGIYPLTIVWPSGWAWHTTGTSMYLQMILGIYATLGIFLILASRDPLANRSLIWFAAWSSLIHAGVMAAQSFGMSGNMNHMGHLMGDVPALLGVAVVLGGLLWSAQKTAAA